MSEIPLRIVPDEIAVPADETTVRFSNGTGFLPNGSTFHISTGSITFTPKPGEVIIPAKLAQELTDRMDELMDELARQGVSAQDALDAFGNSIRNGLLPGPAQPAG